MDRVKKAKPLTCEQYLKKFSRAVRWRLPPQESEEAIADYRELFFQEERDETKLVEELGEPVQAAHLLTDVRTYRRWLAVFALLAVGLFLLAKWAWTAMIPFRLYGIETWWYPVWVMAVGLPLSLYWFQRHGQKNGPLSKRQPPALAAVLVLGAGTLAWTWYLMGPEFLDFYAKAYPSDVPWQIILERELLVEGGMACAVTALAGLVLAKCYDRRWLSVYALGLTVAVLCAIVTFWLRSMSLDWGADELRDYFFPRMVLVGAAGLIGTGVALC